MNLESTKRKTINIVIDRTIYIFNFIWLNTDVLGEIFWFIDGANNGKNFLELTYVAPCTTLCFLANWKSLCHLINEVHVNHLIDDIRKLEYNISQGEEDKRNTKRDNIIHTEISFLNMVMTALNFWNAMTVIAFGTSPLILMYLEYSKTGIIELKLPFFVIYPIDPYEFKYWPYAYLHQVWSACIVVLEIGAADCLFYTYCTYTKIQFRLLQHDFENMIKEQKYFPGNTYRSVDLNSKLIELVRWHQEIIRSVDLLEIIYSRSTLFNFVSSSFIICLTGFNVTAIDDVAFVLSFATFLAMSLLQIFLLCFFGDMIVRSSTEVSDAVYNCKWYLADSNVRKKLLLIIIRGQKPCRLTASGYADVNLRAFTKILSTAWSYFALLKTIYSTT